MKDIIIGYKILVWQVLFVLFWHFKVALTLWLWLLLLSSQLSLVSFFSLYVLYCFSLSVFQISIFLFSLIFISLAMIYLSVVFAVFILLEIWDLRVWNSNLGMSVNQIWETFFHYFFNYSDLILLQLHIQYTTGYFFPILETLFILPIKVCLSYWIISILNYFQVN